VSQSATQGSNYAPEVALSALSSPNGACKSARTASARHLASARGANSSPQHHASPGLSVQPNPSETKVRIDLRPHALPVEDTPTVLERCVPMNSSVGCSVVDAAIRDNLKHVSEETCYLGWQHDADCDNAVIHSGSCSHERIHSPGSHNSAVNRASKHSEDLSLVEIEQPTCLEEQQPETGACWAVPPLALSAEHSLTRGSGPEQLHARQHVWTMQVLPSFICIALHHCAGSV
jgi:hypothetical protein